MSRITAVRRGFTLAELIVAIALLAVFSVFIVQMFAKSDQMAKKARNLDQAVACASNLADAWRGGLTVDVPEEVIFLRTSRVAGGKAAISLNAFFEVCEPQQAVNQAVLTVQPVDGQPGVWQLAIVIGRMKPSDSAPIYSLKTSRYFSEEVSGP
jgi:prepilin-type N-terminal cleavage/methylation domain-containing protein